MYRFPQKAFGTVKLVIGRMERLFGRAHKKYCHICAQQICLEKNTGFLNLLAKIAITDVYLLKNSPYAPMGENQMNLLNLNFPKNARHSH